MSGTAWDPTDVPSLDGRVVVVTGANSGLGLEATALLARHGATVVMACRSTDRGEAGRAALVERFPEVADRLRVRALDLADLSSVQAFADRLGDETGRVDVLLNNAGVMAVPRRQDRRRVRAPARHQPPRALRSHRAPVAVAGRRR